jgi:hypothetical protein
LELVEVEFMEGDVATLSGKKGQFADLLKGVKLASNVRLFFGQKKLDQ